MSPHRPEHLAAIADSVRSALAEDIGTGDVSAQLCRPELICARVICRQTAVLCGQAWFDEAFKQLDPNIEVEWQNKDGDTLHADHIVCLVNGPARRILSAERTALNFLQTLSATATNTRRLLHRLTGSRTKLLDTRKTIPGLRYAQKYAVRCAGAGNHRMGLYDAYLIKENHISACGSISQAVKQAQQQNPALSVEVEVESLAQLKEAIACHADIALLDNFSCPQVEQAVMLAKEKIKLEVSGNITMQTIARYAGLGVDYISAGCLTKHIQAVDFSMLFVK